jgi:hypothetical protein
MLCAAAAAQVAYLRSRAVCASGLPHTSDEIGLLTLQLYVSSYYYMSPHTTRHVTRDLLLSVVYEQPFSSSTTTPSEASISCIASSDTSV